MEMSETATHNRDMLIELTADVVAAYVSNNPVPAGDLPNLIADVHSALGKVGTDLRAGSGRQAQACRQSQAFRDGRLHHLSRGRQEVQVAEAAPHDPLRAHPPEQYREKWGLDSNYPMVAPQLRGGAFASGEEDWVSAASGRADSSQLLD